jgi:hypothetical protein
MLEEPELVANLTGQPPPTPMICDNDKAKTTEGCTQTARQKKRAPAAKEHSEEPGEMFLLLLEVINPSGTGPAQSIEFRVDSNVLSEFGEAATTAFESESAEECLEKLPPGRFKDRILSLTGRPARPGQKCIKLDHLGPENTELVYNIVRRKSLGVGIKDRLLVDSVEHASLIMRNNYDERPYTGVQDASFIIHCRDLYDAGNGIVIMGPTYRWPSQYVKDMSPVDLKRLYYDLALPCQAPDGTTYGDVLEISTSSGSTSSQPNHLMFTGYSSTPGDDNALGGDRGDLAIRVGTGISFSFDQWPHATRQMVSGNGNPCLRVCHGFVAAIAADGNDGSTVLSVRLALGKGNLPAFLPWPRMSPLALISTNLQAVVPARCVLSTFPIKPIVLHSLAACLPESSPVLGEESMPIEWDAYVAGHMHFELGDFQGDKIPESEQQDEVWKRRYDDSSTMAFAMLHDYCARGGQVTEDPFNKYHAPWKEMYVPWTTSHQGGRHLPKATLSSIAPFPAASALSTIYNCARLLGLPSYNVCLGELRSGFFNFASSKAKRSARRPGGKVSFCPNISGSMLLQLVHIHVDVYTAAFSEGAVEAVVDEFHQAEKLFQTKDGVVNLGQLGSVKFEGHIKFRWTHYDPTRNATESGFGPDGKPEVIFQKCVARDRHGGALTGEVHGDEDQQGNGGGKPEGGTNPCNLQVKRRPWC